MSVSETEKTITRFLLLLMCGVLVNFSCQSVAYSFSLSDDLDAREKKVLTQVVSIPESECWLVKSIGMRYKDFQKGEWVSDIRFGKDGLFWDSSDINKMHLFIAQCMKSDKEKMDSHPGSGTYKDSYQRNLDMYAHVKMILADMPMWAKKEKLRLETIAEAKRVKEKRKRVEKERDAQAYSHYLAFLKTSINFLKAVPATDEALKKVLRLDKQEKSLRRKTTLAHVLDRITFMNLLSSVEEKLPFLVKYQKCLKNGLFYKLGVDQDIIDDSIASFNSPETSTVGALVCSSAQEGVNVEYDGPGLFSNTITVSMNTPKGEFSLKLEEKPTGHWLAIELTGPNGSVELKGREAIIYTVKFPLLWRMTGG